MSPIGESRLRIEFHLKGVVQGIGLRPKILRLARQKGIFGSVANCGDSVLIRAQSQKKSHLDEFLENIKIWGELGQIKETSYLESEKDFRIEQSHSEGIRAPVLSPDTAICDLCRAEFYDFNSRRYGYHFISCAECGPRLSIAARTPYDRDLTSWRKFPICQECRREYEDPLDRRFHVEGISCPQCGPTLSLLDSNGEKLSDGKLAIDRVCKELRAGKIIAVKGMTGFHLMVDARNSESLQTLRRAKNRPSKPFALMVANRDEAKKIGVLDSLQTQAFESSIAPIVLVD
ncbi:MAG: carbamoyltransferase HypF, partial [Bdellovibrionales bacterium]|nr:carbamoyltransferase HypF [Bdellovibrionales bacterium]